MPATVCRMVDRRRMTVRHAPNSRLLGKTACPNGHIFADDPYPFVSSGACRRCKQDIDHRKRLRKSNKLCSAGKHPIKTSARRISIGHYECDDCIADSYRATPISKSPIPRKRRPSRSALESRLLRIVEEMLDLDTQIERETVAYLRQSLHEQRAQLQLLYNETHMACQNGDYDV